VQTPQCHQWPVADVRLLLGCGPSPEECTCTPCSRKETLTSTVCLPWHITARMHAKLQQEPCKTHQLGCSKLHPGLTLWTCAFAAPILWPCSHAILFSTACKSQVEGCPGTVQPQYHIVQNQATASKHDVPGTTITNLAQEWIDC
jgi:hypothetical protein